MDPTLPLCWSVRLSRVITWAAAHPLYVLGLFGSCSSIAGLEEYVEVAIVRQPLKLNGS